MGKIITVNFRGDELCAFERDDGVFVALKPIVDAMGIDWSSQHKRISRDPILSEGMVVMTIPFGRGGAQEGVCLKLELVNGFLFTIDSSRIKDDEVRQRVLTYQRECYRVLFEHFYRGERAEPNVPADIASPSGAPVMERVRQVTEARHCFGTSASRELWFKLGLPVTPSMLQPDEQMDMFRGGKVIEHKAAG